MAQQTTGANSQAVPATNPPVAQAMAAINPPAGQGANVLATSVTNINTTSNTVLPGGELAWYSRLDAVVILPPPRPPSPLGLAAPRQDDGW